MINVYEEFKRLSPHIEAALEYTKGTHSIDDIWSGIVEGRFQFWPGEQSAIVTDIEVYPKRRVMHIFLAGGELEELLEMEKAVEAYAHTIGCNSMSISGRRGWLKVFQDDGWQEVCTTIAKEL